MRILVVEDEVAIAHGLRFNFEQEGYMVDVAGDGDFGTKDTGISRPANRHGGTRSDAAGNERL